MTRFPFRNPQPFEIRASSGLAEIYLYGPIGDIYEGGVSADQFRQELQTYRSARRIHLHLNSGGGSAYEGLAMHSLLTQHGAAITTYVDGEALSAAAIVAMAGSEIVIAESGRMMIHEASSTAWGESKDLRSIADRLQESTEQMARLIAARTGRGLSEILRMMAEETWLTGSEAVDKGFADRVIESQQVAACATPFAYKNAPASRRAPRAPRTTRPAAKRQGRHKSHNDRLLRLARAQAE